MSETDLDPRAELATLAASLRAYLEWQVDCGSSGIPRRPRSRTIEAAPVAAAAAAPAPAPEPASAPEPIRVRAAPAAPEPAASAAPPALRSLSVLADEVKTCHRCILAETRHNTVFARGNP